MVGDAHTSQGMPEFLPVHFWSTLSQRYAKGASGSAVGFVDGAAPKGVFTTVEYPTLIANPNITSGYARYSVRW